MTFYLDYEWLLAVGLAPFAGSFLGLLIVRLPAGEPVLWSRSKCRACGHSLTPIDLVPLLSWLLRRGRCRYCGASIGLFYPAIELAALAVALWAATEVSGWLLLASCALGWTLLSLAVIDWKHLLLPDGLTLPLIPAGLAVAFALDPAKLPHHLLGALAGFAALASLAWFYHRLRGVHGLGLGDAKLLAAAGAWLSWQALPSIILIGATSALAVALLRSLGGRPISRGDAVPFGTFLCCGTWLVWLYGPLQI